MSAQAKVLVHFPAAAVAELLVACAWTATVHVEGSECSATAPFQVTLLSTAEQTVGPRSVGLDARAGLPFGLAALVGLLGFGGGALLARRLRLV